MVNAPLTKDKIITLWFQRKLKDCVKFKVYFDGSDTSWRSVFAEDDVLSAVRLLRETISDKTLHNVFVGKEPPRKHLPEVVTRKWVLKTIEEVFGEVGK